MLTKIYIGSWQACKHLIKLCKSQYDGKVCGVFRLCGGRCSRCQVLPNANLILSQNYIPPV